MPAFPTLNPDAFYAESQFGAAAEAIRIITEVARGAVSGAVGSGGITATLINGQVSVTDTRNFRALAFLDPASHTANAATPTNATLAAQTIDVAYTQANLQAMVDLLVAQGNAQKTDIADIVTKLNALLASLQARGIQA